MKCDRPLAQHGDSSASCKEMTIKASKPLDSISAVACTKKIISSSAYWKTSERNASRVGAVCLGLIWACGPMGHNLNNVAEHVAEHVADMWSSGYIVSILSSFKTWMLHHDICKPWQQICLYPWHEMTSGERIVVKSGKSMSIAVSMRISVELRAAMARERILRGRGGRGGRKKNRCSPVANGCTTSGEHTLNPQRSPEWMGTLATHSGRTFDSLPFVHVGKFMKTWYKWYNHVWPKTSKDIFPANTLIELRVSGSHANLELCIQGFLGSRFDLWLWNLGQRSCAWRGWTGWTSANCLQFMSTYFLHVVTAMNLWQLMIRQPCTTRLE